jgi:hypothetical protein
MSVEFYQTRAGRTFYESTMPALVAELARLNSALERLIKQRETEPHGSPAQEKDAS